MTEGSPTASAPPAASDKSAPLPPATAAALESAEPGVVPEHAERELVSAVEEVPAVPAITGQPKGVAASAVVEATDGTTPRQLKRSQGVRTPPAPLMPDAGSGVCASPSTSPTPLQSPKRTRIMPGEVPAVANGHWQGVG